MENKLQQDDEKTIDIAAMVFSAAIEFFERCTMSQASIEKAFQIAITDPKPPAQLINTPAFEIAECLQIWHTSAEYTDNEGGPKPLSQRGSPSLESLAKQVGIANRTLLTVDAVKFGLVKKTKDNLYLPTQREALIPYDGTLPLWYTSQAVCRAFQTMTKNLKNSDPEIPRLFHRGAHQLRLSKKNAAIFSRFFAEQGGEFVQMIDDWMDQHKASSKQEPTTEVSIQTFAWIAESEDSNSAVKKPSKTIKTKNRNA